MELQRDDGMPSPTAKNLLHSIRKRPELGHAVTALAFQHMEFTPLDWTDLDTPGRYRVRHGPGVGTSHRLHDENSDPESIYWAHISDLLSYLPYLRSLKFVVEFQGIRAPFALSTRFFSGL